MLSGGATTEVETDGTFDEPCEKRGVMHWRDALGCHSTAGLLAGAANGTTT